MRRASNQRHCHEKPNHSFFFLNEDQKTFVRISSYFRKLYRTNLIPLDETRQTNTSCSVVCQEKKLGGSNEREHLPHSHTYHLYKQSLGAIEHKSPPRSGCSSAEPREILFQGTAKNQVSGYHTELNYDSKRIVIAHIHMSTKTAVSTVLFLFLLFHLGCDAERTKKNKHRKKTLPLMYDMMCFCLETDFETGLRTIYRIPNQPPRL